MHFQSQQCTKCQWAAQAPYLLPHEGLHSINRTTGAETSGRIACLAGTRRADCFGKDQSRTSGHGATRTVGVSVTAEPSTELAKVQMIDRAVTSDDCVEFEPHPAGPRRQRRTLLMPGGWCPRPSLHDAAPAASPPQTCTNQHRKTISSTRLLKQCAAADHAHHSVEPRYDTQRCRFPVTASTCAMTAMCGTPWHALSF